MKNLKKSQKFIVILTILWGLLSFAIVEEESRRSFSYGMFILLSLPTVVYWCGVWIWGFGYIFKLLKYIFVKPLKVIFKIIKNTFYRKAWKRYFARGVDELIFVYVLSFLYLQIININPSYAIYNILSNPLWFFLVYIMLYPTCITLWLFIEPIFIHFFGCTLGKKLFNIKVLKENNHKLSLSEAYKRNLYLLIYGFWIFPLYIIRLIPLCISYNRLLKGKKTKWDEKTKSVVVHKKVGVVRVLLIIILLILFLYVL